MAPQLMARKGCLRRRLSSWMVRATISLPVPLSPRRSTVASVGATRAILSYTSCIEAERPTRGPKRPRRRSSSRSAPISARSSPLFGTRASTERSRCMFTGLVR